MGGQLHTAQYGWHARLQMFLEVDVVQSIKQQEALQRAFEPPEVISLQSSSCLQLVVSWYPESTYSV